MTAQNFTVPSYDGLELVCRTWYPPANTPTRARVLFLHGFGESTDDYNDWWPRVVKDGYEVTTYDQRGHGNTAKSRSDFGISSEEDVMGDLETMVDFVLKKTDEAAPPRLPLILWGFSMGGACTLAYMVYGKKKESFDLFVAVGPYLEMHPNAKLGTNGLKMWVMPILNYIFPSYTDEAHVPPSMLTNDPAKQEEIPKNPHRHLRASVRFFYAAVTRGRRLQDPQNLNGLVDKPLLVAHAGEDEICDIEATKQFVENAKGILTDVTFYVEEGLPHEIAHCLEKDQVAHWGRVGPWLDQHVAAIEKK